MEDLVIRFIVGGAVVSIFAIVGDSFNKSFGGLFGAAPSVAVASLALTVAREGRLYSAVEARSMLAGSAALLLYAAVVVCLMVRRRIPALISTLIGLPVWFVVAFGCWLAFLR